MKNLILSLVALLSVACGGAEFNADLEGAGGEDSEQPMAGAGGSAVTTGGSSASAGTKPVAMAGASSGGSSGAVPAACALDTAKLAAALPTTINWSGFIYTGGETCVRCRDNECMPVDVVSWGVPEEYEGKWVFRPNTNKPMVPIAIGVNDGVCAEVAECGAKFDNPTLRVSVERTDRGWQVVDATAGVNVNGNSCTADTGAGAGLVPMAARFARELEDQVLGLEITCD